MKKGMCAYIIWGLLAINVPVLAQDSVDVTFRYTNATAASASLVGEFNGWNNSAWPMTNAGGGLWLRTARLPVGINPNADPVKGIGTAWQYKFYYPGASPWPNDPLNHHQNSADNNNTFIYVKDPTIYHLLPNQRSAILTTGTPQISAYLYPTVGGSIDTSSIEVDIDGMTMTGIGSAYDPQTKQFVYTPEVVLENGDHVVVLRAGSNADTVRFTTRSGYAQITTRGGFPTYSPARLLRGLVQDTTLHSAKLVRNGTDTATVSIVAGLWSSTATLQEGSNSFVLVADSSGTPVASSPVVFTYIVSHAPVAHASASLAGNAVLLSAAGSTDPDGAPPSEFHWLDDPSHPLGLAGMTGSSASIPLPGAPGEYYYGLVAVDAQGNADTMRSYFELQGNGAINNPGYADYPSWVRQARVYFLFPKAASVAGNLAGARQRLPSIRDLGFNVIWLMPVMKNAYPIDMGSGPGYNITDFYTVAPEYGTNQDLKDFVTEAHSYGIKVILDITPNHTSRSHLWAVDARTFGRDSRYWSWYEHTLIPHNTNGLDQSLDAYGFAHYDGWDELLDLNWNDTDLRMEMIRMYKYWLLECGVDGFRFDVYWGPHRRYGEGAMGFPVRTALKHVKPGILLLAEDDGTGGGTEGIYADYENSGIRGGVDAAYDFKLYFNQIRGFRFNETGITNLHNEILNGGFYPGPHSLYMRFMESQDEDRIVYFYGANSTIDRETTFRKTMPVASVIFTAPGFPMLWNGQEVGWGYGITSGDKNDRARSRIDWNFAGRNLLAPHYQRLATLRGTFPAFTMHKTDTNGDGAVDASDTPDFVRVSSSNGLVYAFTRPYEDQNGLTVVNVSGTDQSTVLNLSATGALQFNEEVKNQDTVYLNELLGSTVHPLNIADLSSFGVTLPAYGSAVYTVSLTRDTLQALATVTSVEGQTELPQSFELMQNYPNPFNPATKIGFGVSGSEYKDVRLAVYDLLGREVAVLVNEKKAPGNYEVQFNASKLASGVYFYRLTADGIVKSMKMLLLK
jgi:cyclomaltodextrinase / maltogenic alpha-amylase / neopullulanase